jgi:hypothetical protein
MDNEEKLQILNGFAQKLASSQQDIPPHIQNLVNDHF